MCLRAGRGHEREVSAGEQESGDTSANHDQGHNGATAVAEDVSKGEQQELAMAGSLIRVLGLKTWGLRTLGFRDSAVVGVDTIWPSVRRTMRSVCSSSAGRAWRQEGEARVRFRSCIRSISCVALCVSRLAVGSSASTRAGR